MDHSTYEARWLLGPAFSLGLGLIVVGLIFS